MYPTSKFSPSRSPYGNPATQGNSKLRFAIVWKDGVKRVLPGAVRTAQAIFTLSATDEPQQQLPGFWNTEQANTRTLYYYGMLKELYTAHTAHARQDPRIQNPRDLRGLAPSPRWYTYIGNTPSHAPSPPSQPTSQGRAAADRHTNRPGRGHGRLPPLTPQTPSASYAAAVQTTQAPTTDIAVPQMFARLLAGMEGQQAAIQSQIQHQAQINTNVSDQLANIHSILASLQHNVPK